ncbi:unnamed protein product [Gongylonema pulchrum]|uniref:PCAF_N domain-containing protein n=1 Tax=Gongylonema pulchrum TaxID=637853 RepID=A0A183EW37_9BILA|nr:unnamed protein product [Gongylonema pulchrum]
MVTYITSKMDAVALSDIVSTIVSCYAFDVGIYLKLLLRLPSSNLFDYRIVYARWLRFCFLPLQYRSLPRFSVIKIFGRRFLLFLLPSFVMDMEKQLSHDRAIENLVKFASQLKENLSSSDSVADSSAVFAFPCWIHRPSAKLGRQIWPTENNFRRLDTELELDCLTPQGIFSFSDGLVNFVRDLKLSRDKDEELDESTMLRIIGRTEMDKEVPKLFAYDMDPFELDIARGKAARQEVIYLFQFYNFLGFFF